MDKKGKIILVAVLFLIGILVVGMVMAAPRAKKACNDRIDNDGDGYIDLNDLGCTNRNDLSELNPNIECDDGLDNDGDVAIDYNDNGCSGQTDNDETDCGDGICEGGETSGTCPVDCGYPDSCSDTDGGFVESLFGTVSGSLRGLSYNNSDFCVSNTTLVEHYCSSNYAYALNVSCAGNYTSCASGACY